MIETFLLEAIDAFSRCGTLTAAAEELHLTQPTLTRSMHKLESEIGVPLFDRKTHSIRLNECGQLVADRAARILALQREMVDAAHTLERSRTSVAIVFSDPGPMVELASTVAKLSGGITNERVPDEFEATKGFAEGRWQMAVLPHPLIAEGLVSKSVCTERMTYGFTIPDDSVSTEGVHLADIDGRAVLIPADIGVWRERIEHLLPSAQLVDEDELEHLSVIAEHTELPMLSTEIAERHKVGSARSLFSRTLVPVLDDEAKVEFFATCREQDLMRNPSLAQLWELLG